MHMKAPLNHQAMRACSNAASKGGSQAFAQHT